MRDTVSGAIAIPKASWGCAPALPNRFREVFLGQAAGKQKFFGAAVFQKCCRGVGEQPTFAKQIKLHNQMQQKSKRKSEESQLPSKSEGCNERYGFRGNCDSQGKLGMCPSLAESLAVGFSRNHVSRETMYKNKLFLEHWLQILSRRQIKVF